MAVSIERGPLPHGRGSENARAVTFAQCECGVTATGCGDGWPLAREMVWGDAARFPLTRRAALPPIEREAFAASQGFPEPIVMVDFTGAGMPNTWDPNIPPPCQNYVIARGGRRRACP